MSGFAGALGGDGLDRVQRALAGLERDPLRLDRARNRFSHSPPPYRSDPSGTTTRSASPDPPTEEQQRRQQRRVQLGRERLASEPNYQFRAQRSDEEKRIDEADLNGTRCPRIGESSYGIAYENVKKSWVEQGIWNNKWNKLAGGRWKHEESLEIESGSETCPEAEISPLFSFPPKQSRPKPRRPKSDEEKRHIAERRAVGEREREASRPYHQFIYQMSRERKRTQEELGSGEYAADINTTAHENVKNTWTRRGIWNERWGTLPGMSWKHEEPPEEEGEDTAEDSALAGANLRNGSHEAGQVVTRHIFSLPSPVDSNHHQAPGVINTSQQGPSTDDGSARLEDGDADHSSSVPSSPRL